MTDEEVGRKWAEQNGKRPMPRHLSGGYKPWAWESVWRGNDNELPADVLEAVRVSAEHFAETPGGYCSMLSYETEAEAYSALGAAVRRAFTGTRAGDALALNKSTEVTS